MGTPKALPPYVQLRHSGYYFRYVVPLAVRPSVGRRELKYSLRTRSKRTAAHRASRLAALLYDTFRLMKPVDLTLERIQARIKRELTSWTENHLEAELTASPKTPEQAEQLARFYQAAAKEYRETLATGDYSAQEIEARVRELAQSEGVELPSYMALQLGMPNEANKAALRCYNLIASEYAKAEIAFYEDMAARKRGEMPSAYTAGTHPQSHIVEASPTEAPLLSALWEKYVSEKVTQRGWKPATRNGHEATFTEFLEILGDRPVNEISRDSMVDYLAKLQKLPKANLKAYRGSSIAELLAEELPEADLRSSKTLAEARNRVSSFLGWCTDRKLIEANPLHKLTIKSQSMSREPFTQEDLAKLFYSPQYRDGTHRKSWHFWTPLLALYTGARVNEIAQLTLRDIIEIGGSPAIDITDTEAGASVKTAAGFRKVPIHPVLLNIGFMDYVTTLREAGEDRLFPDLTKGTQSWGHKVSQWFNRDEAAAPGYLVKCGIDKRGGRKVFHSFRHTVITHLLRVAKVPLQEVQAIVGHEQSLMGATKTYHHSTFEDSVGVIEQLDFGLDHSDIKGQWKKYASP